MNNFSRYAIYYQPTGALADFGAHWLGWDLATGRDMAHPAIAGVDVSTITATPRKYGFHGTIKPPFRLADGTTLGGLIDATASLVRLLNPVQMDGLSLRHIGRFLALTPDGNATALTALAGHVVAELDAFRAPPTDAELARRRAAGLTPVQDALLLRWGYPYVMDQFKFHLTLTGKLDDTQAATAQTALAAHLPALPAPFTLDALTLVGAREDGYFETIQRFTLTG